MTWGKPHDVQCTAEMAYGLLLVLKHGNKGKHSVLAT